MTDPLAKLIEIQDNDLTEMKRISAIRDAVIEALPDGLVVVDLDGKIVMVNQKATLLFGYSRAELIGSPVEMLLPAGLREVHKQHRLDYNSFDVSPHARTMGLGMQLTGVRKDGRELPVDLQLARAETPDGVFNLALVHYTPRPPKQRVAPMEADQNGGSE